VRVALAELGRLGITSVLLEGGPVLAGAFADAGEIDAARVFIAPLLIGGGTSALAGEGAATIEEATRALASEAETIGDDLLLKSRLREW
jgi:diaminohydroxyphosphoribosylaminopyrimidine deaminase / 5-amino-6-(5-phosphoribosylamino)uracil reductase